MDNPAAILRVFLGIVFLSAGIYRIFNYNAGVEELAALNMPVFLVIPLAILEIGCGILLVINKCIKFTLITLSLFLLLAIAVGFISNGSAIFSQIEELFVFNPQVTDVTLHIVFLIILVVLLLMHLSSPFERK